MILAAHALGVGSAWLGTYPQMERVEGRKKFFNLPERAIPHSLIAFGYPAPEEPIPAPTPGFPSEKAHSSPGGSILKSGESVQGCKF